ncbi:DUF5701 family protein [Streptomyces sp. NPDC059506]|uniref:DUF5701 family protein n=1 Tax=Streptomyces TaxID=1883 RepID=UPI0022AB0FEB|nr:DUF5701 family protein [Streptomyces sp. HB2AG]MCZ2524753.1 DUF5701 family protein [Streptomyces sp. HB2AG]
MSITRQQSSQQPGQQAQPQQSRPQQSRPQAAEQVARGASGAGKEFDRQVENLLRLGYPARAGLDEQAFAAVVTPLRSAAVAHGAALPAPDPAEGRVPFVLVVTRALVPVEESMSLTVLPGRTGAGFVDRSFEPGSVARFVPAEGVDLPDGRAYLLFGVERGEEFCGAVPKTAMETVARRGRTLLTMEEGIALVTQHPGILVKNKCFSLGGSRCGDSRVPAIWISRNTPKLGWCWEGNPHTWLGMASAAHRAAE